MDASKNSPNSVPESKLHFLDYWRIIRIRKTVILAVFLLVVLTTIAVTIMLPKSYMSTVRMEIEKDTSTIPSLLGIRPDSGFDPYFIRTEFEKIQSASVLDQIVTNRNFNLQEKWGKRFGTDRLTIPEARQYLKKQMDVREFRNTSLIEIRVYSPDREEAALLANEIARAYQRTRLAKKTGLSKEGITALKEMQKEQQETVLRLQQEVDDFRRELGISDINSGTGMPGPLIEPEVVRLLERERLEAHKQLMRWRTLHAELSSLKDEDPVRLRNAIPTAIGDKQLDELLSRLIEYRQSLVGLESELTPENPDLKRILSVIGETQKQIEERVNGVLDALKTQVSVAAASHDRFSEQLDAAKNTDWEALSTYRPYFNKKRELDLQEKILDNINFRIVQETVDEALFSEESLVRITDRAEPSASHVRPDMALNLPLGIIVGLMMGIGLAFFIEYLDTSVKTIDDVERALQAPVLGVIPQNVGALIDEGPESPHAEAYRVLRTNLLFSRKNPNANSITVVSGGAGEGKSTTIINLATVFAQSGQRVLLVDSDLRRPSLHKYLNVSNSIGLTNLLLKQNSLEEVIQTTGLPSLNFLPSGKLPSSSMGILNSIQMKEFVQKVKETYDFVFFDSPPIMGVSDASILASSVDMSLLVVQYRKYPQAMTLRAKQMVEKVGGNLLGVVLNNINISQDSYYYYYSGYYYDYYSKHDDSDGSAPEKKNGEPKKQTGDRAAIDLKQKY